MANAATTTRPKRARRSAKAAGAKATPRRVLVSVMKNEAPFILEWVAYHKAIGFDRIVIFSNDSDDGTHELLDALHAADVIEHIQHSAPKGLSAQGHAARLANEQQLLTHGDWVLWIDADEFLNIHVGEGKLDDLIELIGERHGMVVQWRIFGDGGNARFGGRFISPDFQGAAVKRHLMNAESKTFFRHGPDFAGFASKGIHRPLMAKTCNLGRDDFLNGNGVPLREHEVNDRWLGGMDFGATHSVTLEDTGGSAAQINHYCVRTPELFALKKARGRGWAANRAGEANNRHTPGFYAKMNRNGKTDSTILRHMKAVDDGIAELLALPGVQEAHAVGLRRTAAAVARALQADEAATGADQDTDPFPRFAVTLPEAEQALVTEHYKKAGVILEYGSGGSSFLALESGADALFTVESDPVWAEKIAASLQHHFADANCHVHFADIGPTGAWGRPVDDRGYKAYHRYATDVWQRPDFQHPDVILIDGRFRVACFCTALMMITRPVTVLFDDYANRPGYHWIEGLVRPKGLAGRMAEFALVPGTDVRGFLPQIAGSFVNAN